ncbi:CheW-like protein [Shewanella denitrificans OS217]|uniref:Chemotaxis protein CheW n=1 Tax=Shewanella denitrificans (strain OS217 / ATCC BAA-1090 / DSM 15013) TaxID=318161 RepID=Q12J02_SHEDO|nr:chemotaxis protein CheW [Shewanella denitrificans]ABE56574.1 CheW-like protein [Shewanella denitrificans OS217]
MNLPNKRASQPAEHQSSDEDKQYLTFMLKDAMYAIGILHIKEILEYSNVTPVPMMPNFIKGVINLRGAVVPVIDLSARFGCNQSSIVKRTCIVIIEVLNEEGMQDIGVVVDAVSEVIEISRSNIEPAPAFGAQIRADFIQGMGKINGDFVIILQVDKVLSVEEMSMVSNLAQGQGHGQKTVAEQRTN